MLKNRIIWDKNLINKYNISGPRYTSYPTALQFHTSINENDYIKALQISKENKTPLSIYIHIPFCANLCYFCACNKVITKKNNKAVEYLEYLHQEIKKTATLLSKEQKVEQLHFGGGTPTFLTNNQFIDLMDTLRKNFNLKEKSNDYGIEIDPRTVNISTINNLYQLGFNRLSIGVQDLNEDVQKAVHRIQPWELIETLTKHARAIGFKSISIDLIYGLPKQTIHDFGKTIDKIIKDLSPDRISLFNYAHLPNRFKPQIRIKEEDLPTPDDKLIILEQSINKLLDSGYIFIGMDHFAKPYDNLAIAQKNKTLHRNFQGYTTHGHCDLIGFGVSAISQINTLYSQNSNDLNEYQNIIQNNQFATKKGIWAKDDDLIRKFVIMEILCFFELDIKKLEMKFQISFQEYFQDINDQLKYLENDNLINIDKDKIKVLNKGRLLVRNICMTFDKYLNKQSLNRFSKTI